MAVAGAVGFSLVVTEDGHICSFGENKCGELGVGDFEQHADPCILNYVDTFCGHEVVMVDAGLKNCACVTLDGSVWTWGSLYTVPLEDPLQRERCPRSTCRPARMCKSFHGNSPALMVACGADFMLILTASGSVYSFGDGMYGQLGHNSVDSHALPKCIDPAYFDGAEIGMVSAAGGHCMALSKTDGRLWTWGDNDCNETGVISPSCDPILKPTLIPASELDGASVVFVSCGFDFSMLVTSDGVLWSCGNNKSNECGLGNAVDDTVLFERVGGAEYFGPGGVRMISCGFSHSMIVAKNNSVWSCGSSDYGELGQPGEKNGMPGRVDTTAFVNGVVEIASDNDVQVVSAGRKATIVITYGGLVYEWGKYHGVLYKPLPEGSLGFAGNTNDHARAGRWHDANRTRMIAFAMGTHAGFANDAATGGVTAYSADFPEELMRDMFHRMRFAVRKESSVGVRGLLGIHLF